MGKLRILSCFVSILIVTGIIVCFTDPVQAASAGKTRVIATTDGEIDDQCSMVRFLLYANEWDIEGIVTSSSQYHWRGHRWAGDDWIEPYLDAYEKVYPNLVKHDPEYPTPCRCCWRRFSKVACFISSLLVFTSSTRPQ